MFAMFVKPTVEISWNIVLSFGYVYIYLFCIVRYNCKYIIVYGDFWVLGEFFFVKSVHWRVGKLNFDRVLLI